MPFVLRRRQYPVHPAFALTINKSQGQTFKRVAIFLPSPMFAHGQLYVALSRVGDPTKITVMLTHPPLHGLPPPARSTRNVVYKDVFGYMDRHLRRPGNNDMMEI